MKKIESVLYIDVSLSKKILTKVREGNTADDFGKNKL